MTLSSIAPDDIPSASRKARESKYTPELIAQAIELLKDGQAVTPDDTYKTEPAARRAALALRSRILAAEPEFENGSKVTTRTMR